MSTIASFAPETLGLLFLLGMRHGVDPDHIAVIDNITFRALEDRPKVAPWTGFLFSAGHTASVLAIALLFGFLGQMVRFPPEFERAMTFFIIGLFLIIGTLNMRALLSHQTYTPKGWRHGMMPKLLRGSTHPIVTVAIGLVFGLVIDTAAQIATWGAAAASTGGIAGAVLVGLSFAAGMILTDTLDSVIVAGLISGSSDVARVQRYRRGVGWIIVALSYAMAVMAIFDLLTDDIAVSDKALLTLGIVMTASVLIAGSLSLWSRVRAKGPSI